MSAGPPIPEFHRAASNDKVRRYLDEKGSRRFRGSIGVFRAGIRLLQGCENVIQRGLVLELSQVRGIGRTDIDHEEILMIAQRLKRKQVVLRRLFEQRDPFPPRDRPDWEI